MTKQCYACRNDVDWLASRCPYCTSELDAGGNNPTPKPSAPMGPVDVGMFVKCVIVVFVCMWLVSSCNDRYWCKPEHRGSQNEKWVKENCN